MFYMIRSSKTYQQMLAQLSFYWKFWSFSERCSFNDYNRHVYAFPAIASLRWLSTEKNLRYENVVNILSSKTYQQKLAEFSFLLEILFRNLNVVIFTITIDNYLVVFWVLQFSRLERTCKWLSGCNFKNGWSQQKSVRDKKVLHDTFFHNVTIMLPKFSFLLQTLVVF